METTFEKVFIYTSALVLLFFSGFRVYADTEVISPVLINLPPAALDHYVSAAVTDLGGDQQFRAPAQTVTFQGVPVQIGPISANVQFSFATPEVVQSGATWLVQTSALAASVNIPEISVNENLQQVVGGAIVQVHLQASCTDINLSLPTGFAQASAQIRSQLVNGSLGLQLISFQANLAAQSWQITVGRCTGASGLATVIQQEAARLLNNQSLIQAKLNGVLQAQLSKLAQIGNDFLRPLNLPSNINHVIATLDPLELTESKDHTIQLHGLLSVDFTNTTDHSTLSFSFGQNLPSLPVSQGVMVLPASIIQGLAKGSYASGLLHYQTIANNIPGFQNLLDSGFEEFFIWPDLLRFSSKTTFLADTSVITEPSVAWNSQSTNPVLNIKLQLATELSYIADSIQVPYVQFQTPLQCEVQVSVANQQLQATIENPQSLRLKAIWDPAYAAAYNPNQWIATGTVGSSAERALQSKVLDISLPSLNWGGLHLIPQTPSVDSGFLMIPMGQK